MSFSEEFLDVTINWDNPFNFNIVKDNLFFAQSHFFIFFLNIRNNFFDFFDDFFSDDLNSVLNNFFSMNFLAFNFNDFFNFLNQIINGIFALKGIKREMQSLTFLIT